MPPRAAMPFPPTRPTRSDAQCSVPMETASGSSQRNTHSPSPPRGPCISFPPFTAFPWGTASCLLADHLGHREAHTLVFGTHPRRLSAGRTRGDLGRGFPNPGLRMVPACGLSGTGPHSRREVAGKRVELRLHLSCSRHLSIHLFTLARTSLRTSEPPSSGRKNVLWL